ncbi:mitochondrial protein translocase, MPT family [Galdieria sulphuraria]|uniref:Mitochondrial protein translocase, MPT family n=1 Tax=Galdieria sulphuraria TaxID=130081 RepID=M2XTI9_GALSU|nr:mitochondrial protein translocase, MPT family [Galdieria sulphuraria]EME26968.1 mitochondrial protein translocase, MPT family [Galdieria sulphuraria]|eukprot:XP_005703488.1 mitochondrial protein translocase, MPT family [Galdieria sulphuraria]
MPTFFFVPLLAPVGLEEDTKPKNTSFNQAESNYRLSYSSRCHLFPGRIIRKFATTPATVLSPCDSAFQNTSIFFCSMTQQPSWKESKENEAEMEQVIQRLESFRFQETTKTFVKSIHGTRRFPSSLENTGAVLPPPGTSALGWYNKRIRSAALKRELKRVLSLVREMKYSNMTQPNTVTYAIALSCCAKLRAVEEARKLWSWYLEDKLPVDNHVYSSMIAVYARTVPPQYDSAWVTFQQLKHFMKPNKVVYNAMIDICSRTDRMEQALKLYQELKLENGETPDEYTYNAILKGYARAGNLQSAIEVSNQMHSEGIIPRAITYSVLIDSLGKCKRLDEAFGFFEEMEAKGIQPNVITFNVLLSACAASNNYTRALVIVDWMEERGVAFDRYTYNALMQASVNSKQYEETVKWYEKMIHSLVTPNNVTFRYLVEAAGGLVRFDLVQLGSLGGFQSSMSTNGSSTNIPQ